MFVLSCLTAPGVVDVIADAMQLWYLCNVVIVLQQRFKVVITCRPVRVRKPMESAETISMLGAIMSTMIDEEVHSPP